MWLRDFLSAQLPSARIMSYGYNGNTFFSNSIADIDDVAVSLLDSLDGERLSNDCKGNPIIFISHSLGGIVVKKVGIYFRHKYDNPADSCIGKALILAHERSSIYGHLLDCVRGLVFFSVPHRGADLAYWGTLAANLLKIAPLGLGANANFVQALKRNSKEFANISHQFVERSVNVQIRTFYETRKIMGQLVRLLSPELCHSVFTDGDRLLTRNLAS